MQCAIITRAFVRLQCTQTAQCRRWYKPFQADVYKHLFHLTPHTSFVFNAFTVRSGSNCVKSDQNQSFTTFLVAGKHLLLHLIMSNKMKITTFNIDHFEHKIWSNTMLIINYSGFKTVIGNFTCAIFRLWLILTITVNLLILEEQIQGLLLATLTDAWNSSAGAFFLNILNSPTQIVT